VAVTGESGALVQRQQWQEHQGDAGSPSGKVVAVGAHRGGTPPMGRWVRVVMAALEVAVELWCSMAASG
jgi:hypothetical protein